MESADSGTPSLNVQLELLSDSERRRVIAILSDSELPLTLRDIATELVTHGYDTSLVGVPSEDVQNAFARLHHVHLPKLAAAGVLDYDADRQRIDEVSVDGLDATLMALTDDETD